MPGNIQEYINDARSKKISDEQIKATLLSAGWQESQIAQALQTKYADGLLPPPPPPSISHIGMWTGFLYIIFFISLYTLMSSIAGIMHNWVDSAIPDTTNDYNTIRRNVSNYMTQGFIAAIIVSYPIFTALAIILKKQIIKNPLVKNLRSRKLLIYITLIVTFLIMLCHITAIIYSFLGGNLSGNAMGHLGVTMLVAGSLFAYFVNEIKHDRKND